MAAIRPEIDPVYITSAEVTTVRERMHSPKRFVYEIHVEWSDSHSTTSYRGYTDFFDFQCELLNTFREEAGAVKGAERTLPFIPGKKLFQRRRLALAEQRLPQLNEYVKKLLAMPKHISRCDKVFRFFRSNWNEDRLRRGSFGSSQSIPWSPRDVPTSPHGSTDALLFSENGTVGYSRSAAERNVEDPSVEYSVRKWSNESLKKYSPVRGDSNAIHSIKEEEEQEEEVLKEMREEENMEVREGEVQRDESARKDVAVNQKKEETEEAALISTAQTESSKTDPPVGTIL